MQNFANYSHIESTALLLLGSPGSGKSTRALEFPGVYVFDADRNLSGPLRFMQKQGKDLSTIKFDYGDQTSDGKPVSPFFRWQHMAECLRNAIADPEIKTIVLDGISAIQEMVKDDIFRQRVGPQIISKGREVLITEANRSLGQLTEPEWGIYGRYWNALISSLKSTRKTIVVTGHDETRQNEQNSIWEYTLSLQGQQRYKFAGLFSDVILCQSKTTGSGPTEQKMWQYRTCPVGEQDKRGLKDSFQLDAVFTDFSKLIQHLIETKSESK